MQPIEDYALIGDCETAALVGKNGSIDWLCFPRFDSPACFAALLGSADHGCWRVAPEGEVRKVSRRYREGTLILETEFETETGTAALIDLMPLRDGRPDLVRMVVGREGEVAMQTELVIRFDYGSLVPWVRQLDGGISAIAGPDALMVRTNVPLHGKHYHTYGEFTVRAGEQVPFVLSWYPSHEDPPAAIDANEALRATEQWWTKWSQKCEYQGKWAEPIRQSLVVLKALTFAPSGGIVAAPTTSLPEHLGGSRNWDYRYCWLRDATFTLDALLAAGYIDEACQWRDWLLRAVAGKPTQLQIMYGVCGERRLTELDLDWLPGYEKSSPVRIGNDAYRQFQLDVFGEVMDLLHEARVRGMQPDENAWQVQKKIMDHLESIWDEPDESLWEMRGPPRHFTHSKMMAWVGVDRAVKAIERFGLEGPLDRWKSLRDTIHQQVCREGYSEKKNSFVQFYGADQLDAALLTMPLVGFLPASDPRVRGTIEAIERELAVDGFVKRYEPEVVVDGQTCDEGTFLLCSFWLATCLGLIGRLDDAIQLYEQLLDCRNDVGLLSEEYDPRSRRFLGNFPQAYSHVALIDTAKDLCAIREERHHCRGD